MLAEEYLDLNFYTVEEYFEIERSSELRHEFENRRIFVRAGKNYNHCVINVNIITALDVAFSARNKPFWLFNSSLRLHIEAAEKYYYPDAMVVCEEVNFANEKRTGITNPTVVIEVLSDSTELRDKGVKMTAYQNTPSVKAYLLISQNELKVEVYTRQANRFWEYRVYDELADVIPLSALDIEVDLEELYEDVIFEE